MLEPQSQRAAGRALLQDLARRKLGDGAGILRGDAMKSLTPCPRGPSNV